MPSGVLSNKDFWGGLMLVAIGATAMALGRDYPFGSALRMGPGYFPMVLGALLILFGLSIMATGLRRAAPIEGSWSPRALVVLRHEQGAEEVCDAESEEHAGNHRNPRARRELKKRPQVGEEGEMSNENQHGADHTDGDTGSPEDLDKGAEPRRSKGGHPR